MKTSRLNFILTTVIVIFFVSIPQAEAQILNKLKKKAENAATKKLEKKTEEETNKAMDTILGNGKQNPKTDSPNSGNSGNQGNSSNTQTQQNTEDQEVVEIYSKSDWVAGENVILFLIEKPPSLTVVMF